jgi:hypothetical protein
MLMRVPEQIGRLEFRGFQPEMSGAVKLTASTVCPKDLLYQQANQSPDQIRYNDPEHVVGD